MYTKIILTIGLVLLSIDSILLYKIYMKDYDEDNEDNEEEEYSEIQEYILKTMYV